jgi:hypothetical protein
MASAADRLLGEALKPAPDERARLVAELLATLEPDVPTQKHGEDDWLREIERRAQVAMAGGPEMSWTEARSQVKNRLSSQ